MITKEKRVLVVKVGDKAKGWIPADTFMDKYKKRILPCAKLRGYDDVLIIPVQMDIVGPLL